LNQSSVISQPACNYQEIASKKSENSEQAKNANRY